MCVLSGRQSFITPHTQRERGSVGIHILYIQCCQVYGYIRILRIFKAFLDYGGISLCAAVSTDFSSHARDLLFNA